MPAHRPNDLATQACSGVLNNGVRKGVPCAGSASKRGIANGACLLFFSHAGLHSYGDFSQNSLHLQVRHILNHQPSATTVATIMGVLMGYLQFKEIVFSLRKESNSQSGGQARTGKDALSIYWNCRA